MKLPRNRTGFLCLSAIRLALAVTLLLAVVASGQADISAQTPPPRKRPRIETEESEFRKVTHTESATEAPRQKTRAVSRSRRRSAPNSFPVTFITGSPAVEIFLNGASVGKTGTDGELETTVKTGSYQIISRQADGTPAQQLLIRLPEGVSEVRFSPGTLPGTAEMAERAMNVATKRPASTITAKSSPEMPEVEAAIRQFLAPSVRQDAAADWQKALTESEQALRQHPAQPELKMRAAFIRGQMAYLRGDYQTALAAFIEAERVAPDSVPVFLGLGNAFLAVQKTTEAIRAYQRALQLAPDLASAWQALGDAYTVALKGEEAVALYQRARELGYAGADTNGYSRRNRARLLMSLERWESAIAHWRALIEHNPSVEAWLAMGQCYEKLQQWFSAAQAYARAAELDRRSASVHFQLGSLLFRMRDYRAAKETLEKAIALDVAGTVINRSQANQMIAEADKEIRRNN